MAILESTLAQFQLLCAECADAIGSQDWSLARIKYAQAEAINVSLTLEAGSAGETARMRESLDGLCRAIDSTSAHVAGADEPSRFVRTCTRFN